MRYQKNNIIFRIASSDAISRFKREQAASFLQLTRKELNFDKSSRETVLLEFDRFSQLIFRFEKICCAVGEGEVTAHLRTSITESIIDELVNIETIMARHEEVFTKSVCEYGKIIHKYSVPILLERIDNLDDIQIDVAFGMFVDALSSYLQHILLACHEYNANIANLSKTPFITVSDFNSIKQGYAFEPEVCRISYFLKSNCGTQYTLKNYSDADIFDDVAAQLVSLGVMLIPEESTESHI